MLRLWKRLWQISGSLLVRKFITSALWNLLGETLTIAAIHTIHARIDTLRWPRHWQYTRASQGRKIGCHLSIGHAQHRYLRSGRQLAQHRSEEHTSELQSLAYLVCRLL